ncbi:MAG: M3 family oligoendopeptidase [Treponema sp.]|nr:M3 family oligoendopeptidase [Treponema sp.]
MAGSEALPRWNLDPLYPGFDSPAYRKDMDDLRSRSEALLDHMQAAPGGAAFGPWLNEALRLETEAGALAETLGSYAYTRYSTATTDARALAELNKLEEMGLPLKRAGVLFRNVLAARRAEVEALVASDPRIAEYAFHLREEMLWASRQMSPELEDLAEDLNRAGGDAWGRLQDQVSSTASVVWDEATGERKTTVQLRALATDPDRAVREKAWNLELKAWEQMKLPLAAALNGVKGFAVTLNKRRGWSDPLEKSVEQCRITRATLDALISAMEESLPLWRRYLKIKAKYLGVPACAFYDIFAPVGAATDPWTFERARDFIVEKFGAFSKDMGDFAARAFREGWIDAEPREGKVGGAYCISFPDRKVSRVLCNFDGSFGEVSTIAHELGHAYHHEVIKDVPYPLAQYPMTLAETASIFAETVVFEEAVKDVPPDQKAGLLENNLQNGCQILVDILSRFYFEKSVFARRPASELGAEELCNLMREAQEATYGDGLDKERRHPYMWAVKSHYYSPDLSFYNFPYAFGLLFGLGLYETYRRQGPSFAETYREILLQTGRMSAVDLTRRAGFDIEGREFWLGGIEVFNRQVDEFERLYRG